MIITLSPSKGQDFVIPASSSIATLPVFIKETEKLIQVCQQLTSADLKDLMKVSDNIADLNVKRFQQFCFPLTKENSKAALFAFKGDVYSGISKWEYSESDLQYAQQHLRILSGLYGLLKPMDLIQAYRLEMKTKLKTDQADNLYQFWHTQITEEINFDLAKQKEKTLVNLASNEYCKVIQPKLLKGRLLNIAFKEIKGDEMRVIAIFAKRARGMMADFILRHQIEKSEDIKAFKSANYQFNPTASNEQLWVFSRLQPEKK